MSASLLERGRALTLQHLEKEKEKEKKY